MIKSLIQTLVNYNKKAKCLSNERFYDNSPQLGENDKYASYFKKTNKLNETKFKDFGK